MAGPSRMALPISGGTTNQRNPARHMSCQLWGLYSIGCKRGSTCYTQPNSWVYMDVYCIWVYMGVYGCILYMGVYRCIWGTAGGKTHISQLSTCWLLTRIIIILYHASYICPSLCSVSFHFSLPPRSILKSLLSRSSLIFGGLRLSNRHVVVVEGACDGIYCRCLSLGTTINFSSQSKVHYSAKQGLVYCVQLSGL